MTRTRRLMDVGSKAFMVVLALALVFTYMSSTAKAEGEAANKLAAGGSETEVIGDGDTVPVLTERMKVSSPRDLILQLTSECSILTALTTNNDEPSAEATSTIKMYITIDGHVVPVSADDADNGRAVFCNRDYKRTVTDQEDDDGMDQESDYIRTRTANAFNWVALNSGEAYDEPENGNNILDIVVYAEFDSANDCANPLDPTGETCTQAIVGNRTLVVENTNAMVDEVVTPADPEPAPEPQSCGLPACLP